MAVVVVVESLLSICWPRNAEVEAWESSDDDSMFAEEAMAAAAMAA